MTAQCPKTLTEVAQKKAAVAENFLQRCRYRVWKQEAKRIPELEEFKKPPSQRTKSFAAAASKGTEPSTSGLAQEEADAMELDNPPVESGGEESRDPSPTRARKGLLRFDPKVELDLLTDEQIKQKLAELKQQRTSLDEKQGQKEKRGAASRTRKSLP